MKYKVAVEWVKTHEIEVEAESLEEAIEILQNDDGSLINTDIDGEYLTGSFEVNEEVTEELNNVDGPE